MKQVAHVARDQLLPLISRSLRRPTFTPSDAVLILQPDHLGDILLSQPAVHLIREAFPSTHLVGVVGPWSEDIAWAAWPVDQIIPVEFPGFTRKPTRNPAEPYRYLHQAARLLLPTRARTAVVLRPDAWWAAWLAACVSPTVVASNDPRVAPFATTTAEIDPAAHASVRAAQIVGALTNSATDISPAMQPLSLTARSDAHTAARALLHDYGIGPAYAVIHPGSGATVKEWPLHRWRALASWLAGQGLDVVITGTEGERTAAEQVACGARSSAMLAGRTTLATLAEIMRGAHVVVGPDCGPLHLAVSTGTPSVHLFGPSDARRYGPWGISEQHAVVSAHWSCPRCGDLSPGRPAGCGCMLAISVEQVADAVAGVLNARHGS